MLKILSLNFQYVEGFFQKKLNFWITMVKYWLLVLWVDVLMRLLIDEKIIKDTYMMSISLGLISLQSHIL